MSDKEINFDRDDLFTVESSRWSREDFLGGVEVFPEVEKAAASGRRSFPMFDYFQVDGFHSFWKSLPTVKDSDVLDSGALPHRKLISHMLPLEEFKVLQGLTVGSRFNSMIATSELNAIIVRLPDDVKKVVKDVQEKSEDMEKSLKLLRSLRSLYKRAESDEDQEWIKKEGVEARAKAEADQKALEVAEASLDPTFTQHDSAVRYAVRETLKTTTQKLQSISDAQEAFGASWGLGVGSPTDLPLAAQLEIARTLLNDPMLQKIATMAGRVQRIADKAKRTQTKQAFDEIVGVTTGDRIGDLIGGERIRFAHPVLSAELFSRLLDHKAIIWKKEGTKPEGRGPMIAVIDSSGSMATAHGKEQRIVWAKAVALALHKEAIARKQPFVYIHFSGPGQMAEEVFEGKVGEEAKLMRHSRTFYGGGTEYIQTFDRCLVHLGEQQFEKADVVFISDGEFPLTAPQYAPKIEQFKAGLKARRAKCYGVYTGGYGGTTFKSFCDACWGVDPGLMDGSDVGVLQEMFGEIPS